MNKRLILIALKISILSILILGSPISAETETHYAPSKMDREQRMLMLLLRMETEELANLRQTIVRIEAMSAEERNSMRKRLSKLQTMPTETKEAIKKRIEAIPHEQREAMRNRWFSMSPQERMRWRKKLRQMPPKERAAAMEEQGFLPPHPNKQMKAPRTEEKKGPTEKPPARDLESTEITPEF